MSDDTSSTSVSPTPPSAIRRSSFTGQTFADLFGSGRASMNGNSSNSNNNAPQQYPGPITTAAAQAQRRRLSLTTLGLSGANGQTSPFNSFRGRTESFGSANSGSIEESAIAEDDAGERDAAGSTPITRRTSFGARALRDIRRGSLSGIPTLGGNNGGSPGTNGTSSPPSSTRIPAPNGSISSRDAMGRGEGFNWSDNFRTRAERHTSISAQSPVGSQFGTSPSNRSPTHTRAKSVAVMEPPINEMPKPRELVRPDHFQERILKGDFYMD